MTSFTLPTSASKIVWNGPIIEVISLGCGSLSSLSEAAIRAINNSEVIIGAPHHFDEISGLNSSAQQLNFPSPFSELESVLLDKMQQKIVVLASGDALFYGVGSTLNKLVGQASLTFHPNISSIQACFHHIGLPWQHANVISLHGRSLSTLRRSLTSGQLLAVLTDGRSNPTAIGKELLEQGFGESIVWVCEAMGSDAQKVTQYNAAELTAIGITFHSLNICIVQVKGVPEVLPSFAGIADHLFSTDAEPGFGMISKREVRLCILSLMQPSAQETAWDIGAGCGSVSVEWARWNPQGKIVAIESDEKRISHIQTNCERFGTAPNVQIMAGQAPQACEQLNDPDCIFVGGSNGLQAMLDFAWSRLKPGGKLVASAVTQTSQQALRVFYEGRDGREWIEMQVTKNLPNSEDERSLAPVIIAKCIKPV